ncbi:MAG TPA: hypothetical protein VGO40_16425 [Longimicrobium sp.]|jgi:hypothetical protein|nr:hypothetical protein [Longimicrobium sp.]
MPGCAPFTLTGITPDVWTRLKALAEGARIPVSGEAGTASSQGVTAAWRRDAEANTLTITVTAMPILTDCATVQAVLREVVRSCGGV